MHKGKLRGIPVKGTSKPVDVELDPPTLLFMDPNTLVSLNVMAMRGVEKVGVASLDWISAKTLKKETVSIEKSGTGGLKSKKGKFKEVGLYKVSLGTVQGMLAAEASGKVIAGKWGAWSFGLQGWEWSPLFQAPKEEDVPTPTPDSEMETNE